MFRQYRFLQQDENGIEIYGTDGWNLTWGYVDVSTSSYIQWYEVDAWGVKKISDTQWSWMCGMSVALSEFVFICIFPGNDAGITKQSFKKQDSKWFVNLFMIFPSDHPRAMAFPIACEIGKLQDPQRLGNVLIEHQLLGILGIETPAATWKWCQYTQNQTCTKPWTTTLERGPLLAFEGSTPHLPPWLPFHTSECKVIGYIVV